MSDQITVLAGSVVSISPNLPATYDDVGFEAVTGWLELSEALTLSGGGFTMEESSYVPLKTGTTVQRPGVRTNNPYEITYQPIPGDAGQAEYLTLAEGRLPFSLKIEFPNGDVEYTVARGSGFARDGGGAGEYANGSASFWQDERGAVVVEAA